MFESENVTARELPTQLIKQLRFLGGFVRSPQRLGAVAPTSSIVCDVIASHISSPNRLPVLELGPGTGAVTDAILRKGVVEEDILAVEFDQKFCTEWALRYPSASIIRGNALDLDASLEHLDYDKFDCVVSGIPMLNFGKADHKKFLDAAFSRIAPGRPIIQITYGNRSPIIVEDPAIVVECSPRIMRNFPPAKVWTYRRPE